MKPIIIIGAGEHGSVAQSLLVTVYGSAAVAGFFDDNIKKPNVIGTIADVTRYRLSHVFFVAIGNNAARADVLRRLQSAGITLINAIHPTALIVQGTVLGVNIMAGARTYINTGSKIDDGVFINNGSIIEHDSSLGYCTHVAPGAILGGGVVTQERVFIGLGAVVKDHITIGAGSTIGAGAVVISNVEPGITVVGIPARPLIK